MLEFQNVNKTYTADGRKVEAIVDTSFTIGAGGFAAVRGPSGCGKSTLLLAAGGLLRPESGRVTIDGNDVYSLSPEKRAVFRAKMIGFVFQQFHLVPYLNVLDNVLAASIAAPSPDAGSRAKSLLDRFGMTDRLHHVPSQLSTGERQRTALARALLNQPKLILADEPTGNLDSENAELVMGYMKEFTESGGAVLLVTHDDRATGYAGQVLQMESGRLLESSTITE